MMLDRTIANATERMAKGYAALPPDYFKGRDASTFRFNNITRITERASPPQAPLADLISRATCAGPSSMYFGVPWCEKICSFCNFAYSTSQSVDVHLRYISNLLREFEIFREQAHSEIKVASVYFGGGTPSVLRPEILSEYLTSVLSLVPLQEKHSICCEFSSSTISAEKLEIMRDVGVTRISTGVQSLDGNVRVRANLVGSGEEAMRSILMAQEYFDNFNIDLIYGYPHQTNEDWYSTILTVAKLGLSSITLYRLEVKTHTTVKKIYAKDDSVFADELHARLQYFIAREILEEHGYIESPLGWWIKKDRLLGSGSWQTHLNNWRVAMPYFGFGQGAFSLARGVYYENYHTLSSWESVICTSQLPVLEVKGIEPWAQDLNQLMRLIRVAKEFSFSDVIDNSALAPHAAALSRFFTSQAEIGLFVQENNWIKLTEIGESLVHWIFDDMIFDLLGPDR